MRKKNRPPPTPGPDCGTYEGYKRHDRNDEKPCADCRQALLEHSRQARKKLREGPGAWRRPARRRMIRPIIAEQKAAQRKAAARTPAARKIQNEAQRRRYWDRRRRNPEKQPPTPAPSCGTRSGYNRHIGRYELPCPDCQQAQREHHQANYTRKTDRNIPAKCGTESGYKRHRRNKEEPCDDCRQAARAADRRRARQKKNKKPPSD